LHESSARELFCDCFDMDRPESAAYELVIRETAVTEPSPDYSAVVAYRDRIAYGTRDIAYGVIRSERTTLGIDVMPNGAVMVRAPEGASRDAIRAVVRKKARWITKQRREVSALLLPASAPKEYVAGETHWFLGRNYRLRLHKASASRLAESVRLGGQFIHVTTEHPDHSSLTKASLTDWFRAEADARLPVFYERGAEAVRPYGIEATEMQVYAMEKRWGSFTPSRRILLNPRLIHAAPRAVEYVVIHELCHLKHPYHDAAFYDLLGRILPTWQARKETLEKTEIGR